MTTLRNRPVRLGMEVCVRCGHDEQVVVNEFIVQCLCCFRYWPIKEDTDEQA